MTNVATAPGSDAACCTPKAGKGGFAKFLCGLIPGLIIGLFLGAVAPDWLKAMNAQPNKQPGTPVKHPANALEPPVVPPPTIPAAPSIDQSRPTPADPTKPVTAPR